MCTAGTAGMIQHCRPVSYCHDALACLTVHVNLPACSFMSEDEGRRWSLGERNGSGFFLL
jgi:hypothetical protein